jgi:CHASE3 domain sensor protein
MEDAVYREELRKRLAKARSAQQKRTSGLGTALVTIVLLIGVVIVLLHNYGLLDLNAMAVAK